MNYRIKAWYNITLHCTAFLSNIYVRIWNFLKSKLCSPWSHRKVRVNKVRSRCMTHTDWWLYPVSIHATSHPFPKSFAGNSSAFRQVSLTVWYPFSERHCENILPRNTILLENVLIIVCLIIILFSI